MEHNTKLSLYNFLLHRIIPQTSDDDESGKTDIQIIASADVHLVAAEKAIDAGNDRLAVTHCQNALTLLGEKRWEKDTNDLTISIYAKLAKAERLSTNFKKALEEIEKVLQRSLTKPQKIEIYCLKILTLAILEKPNEVITVTYELFGQIDFNLKEEPPENFSIEVLQSLPPISEEWKFFLLCILKTFGEMVYTAKPELCLSIVYTEMHFCLEHGYSPLALQCFCDYALVLSWQLDKFELGYDLAKLAFESLKSPENDLSKPTVLHIYHGLIRPWREPISDVTEALLEAFRCGVESNDELVGGFAILVYLDLLRTEGQSLSKLSAEYFQRISDLKKLGWEYHLPYAQIGHQLSLQLQGSNEIVFDEKTELERLIERKNYTAVFFYYHSIVMIDCLLGNFENAIAASKEADKYQESTTGLIVAAENNFYDSICQLNICSSDKNKGQQDYLSKVATNQQKLERWSQHGPMNFLHKYWLVEAERFRTLRNYTDAASCYERAITLAIESGITQDIALSYELAGNFYLLQGQSNIGRNRIKKAYENYANWGAIVKTEQLGIRFTWLSKNTIRISKNGRLRNRKREINDPLETWVSSSFFKNIENKAILQNCRIYYFRIQKTLVLEFPNDEQMNQAWRNAGFHINEAARRVGDLIHKVKYCSPNLEYKPFSVSEIAGLAHNN